VPSMRDCDDGSADVHANAGDRAQDGVDQDCDGTDGPPAGSAGGGGLGASVGGSAQTP